MDTLADLAAEYRGLPRRNVTTAAVIEELRHYDLDVSGLGWLEVQHVDGLAELTALVRWMERVSGQKSNHGEATVLAWADVHGAVAVIDDLDARKAARAGGLTVWGVLRVIAEGVRGGRATEYVASGLVDALLASGARYPFAQGGFLEWARKNGLL
ncbi:hypothetical protein F7R91_21845 [Streptomyces luteolifulvus]|uniref:DUF3368 domain-containing protein n=1 Tax=Streptomyces luteolifulvus TaxID=2615112 RepID=A0A6H9UY03_9ACTN|nr:hypothetical protein [Streptomyces luteolifulvus]KAB1144461.1 hypothetical protein F7R91_21845 [Streptomyces luteolifulvus]